MISHSNGRRLRAFLAFALYAAAIPVHHSDARPAPDSGALQELAVACQSRPSAERIDITITSEGIEQQESITVATRPPGDARIEFGPYIAWLNDRFVRVIHRQDMKGLYEAPVVGATPLQTLESLFPPLPVPQLSLFYTPRGRPIELTTYCQGVTWSTPIDKVGAGGLESERIGTGPRVQAQLFSIDNRITRLIIRADNDQKLEIVSTPLPGFDINKAMESELGRRTQVASIGDLQPRPGDSGVGSPLPPLLLTASDAESGVQTPEGPCAILFFDAVNEDLAVACDAVRAVREKRPTLEFWPTLVSDIFESRLSFRIDDARVQFGPDLVYYTLSPTTTVERFSDAGRAVLVIVDDQSIVRAVLPLAGIATENGGPDEDADHEARVARLAEVIQGSLRPQPATP